MVNKETTRTDLRKAASRANGSKSRGPVSDHGKQVSARNRTRHGLLARTVVLDGESLDRFHELLDELHGELEPATGIELQLLENMAVCRWRQMRLWGMEKAGIGTEVAKQRDAATEATHSANLTADACRKMTDESRRLDVLNRYETRFDRQYDRALARFHEHRACRGPKKPDFPNEPEKQ